MNHASEQEDINSNKGKNENSKREESANLFEKADSQYDKLSICESGYVVNPGIKWKTILGYNRKVRITKESVNRYRVIVTYVEVAVNERKIKRAIIEDVLKNS